jgi:hypothetical protein
MRGGIVIVFWRRDRVATVDRVAELDHGVEVGEVAAKCGEQTSEGGQLGHHLAALVVRHRAPMSAGGGGQGGLARAAECPQRGDGMTDFGAREEIRADVTVPPERSAFKAPPGRLGSRSEASALGVGRLTWSLRRVVRRGVCGPRMAGLYSAARGAPAAGAPSAGGRRPWWRRSPARGGDRAARDRRSYRRSRRDRGEGALRGSGASRGAGALRGGRCRPRRAGCRCRSSHAPPAPRRRLSRRRPSRHRRGARGRRRPGTPR